MEESQESQDSKSVLGMIALEHSIFPDVNKFTDIFQEDWGISIDASEYNGEDKNTSVLQVDGQIAALMFLDKPIPWSDLEPVCNLAYYWQGSTEALKEHKAHIIVSVMSDNSSLEKYSLLTKIITSLLKLSAALGVYMGTQNLILSPEQYLEDSQLLANNSLPLSLWVYFGLFTEKDEKISGYTYGLSEFGKMELEISQSSKSLSDIYGFLYNISHYLLAHSPTLAHGETIGMNADQKVTITHQASRYLDDTTIIDLDF